MTSAPKFKNIRIICQPRVLPPTSDPLQLAGKFRGEAGRDLLKATEAGIGVVDVTLVSVSGFLHAQAGGIPPVILAQRMLGCKDQEFKPSLNYVRLLQKKVQNNFFMKKRRERRNGLSIGYSRALYMYPLPLSPLAEFLPRK